MKFNDQFYVVYGKTVKVTATPQTEPSAGWWSMFRCSRDCRSFYTAFLVRMLLSDGRQVVIKVRFVATESTWIHTWWNGDVRINSEDLIGANRSKLTLALDEAVIWSGRLCRESGHGDTCKLSGTINLIEIVIAIRHGSCRSYSQLMLVLENTSRDYGFLSQEWINDVNQEWGQYHSSNVLLAKIHPPTRM